MHATNFPSRAKAHEPGRGAVGIFQGQASRAAVRPACGCSAASRARACAKKLSICRNAGSYSSTPSPSASQTASFVTSSTVGPSPPVAIAPSRRSSTARIVAAMRPRLSPTPCVPRTSTPSSASRPAIARRVGVDELSEQQFGADRDQLNARHRRTTPDTGTHTSASKPSAASIAAARRSGESSGIGCSARVALALLRQALDETLERASIARCSASLIAFPTRGARPASKSRRAPGRPSRSPSSRRSRMPADRCSTAENGAGLPARAADFDRAASCGVDITKNAPATSDSRKPAGSVNRVTAAPASRSAAAFSIASGSSAAPMTAHGRPARFRPIGKNGLRKAVVS